MTTNLLRSLLPVAVLVAGISYSSLSHAVTCTTTGIQATNPDSVYTDNGDGTVTHNPTGLTWKRCVEGQVWDGNSCTGTAATYTWQQALKQGAASNYAGRTDWRLPNIKELGSLMEGCRVNPNINDTIFPNTPTTSMWSSSPFVRYQSNAWLINFGNGFPYANTDRSALNGARLVRNATGQASSALMTVAPPIIPYAARLDIQQSFVIRGTNLVPGMGFAVEDCDNVGEEAGGTSTQRIFHCTPRLPGAKKLTVKTAQGGTVLRDSDLVMVDNPTRLGDVAARGMPSSNGISHWNGNVYLAAIDMVVPGKGLSFTLSRSYNSYYSPYEDARGAVSATKPWRFNWDITLGYVAGTTDLLWVEREDGSGERFFKQSGTWYPMNQGNFNTLKGDTPIQGQTTLSIKNGLQYIFQNPDLGGKLIKIQDHDGNSLTVLRDANGRVVNVVDTSGRTYTFTYNAVGQLTRVTDFAGRHVDYTWQNQTSPNATLLSSVRDIRGGVTAYEYAALIPTQGVLPAAQWALTKVTDPNGNVARRYTYSDTVYGNWGAISYQNALNSVWNYNYCAQQVSGLCDNTNPSGATQFVTTQTPPLGGVSTNYFDTAGRFVRLTDGNQNDTKFTLPNPATLTSTTYNLASTRKSIITALNNITAFTYTPDNLGNLATLIDAENATTRHTYLVGTALANGLISKNLHWMSEITSPLGFITSQIPTASGKVASRTIPGIPASTTTWSYDPAGQPATVTDARNNTSTRTFDEHGNLTKVTEPGKPTRFVTATYDDWGRVLTSTDRRGAVTTNTWDAAGNLLSTTDALGGVISYTYDANGNKTSMTDANGNVTTYVYDALNRLVSVTRQLNGQNITTTNTYDVLGRVVAVTNANNHSDTSGFDNEGNVLSRSNALGQTTLYQYDAEDRVIRTTDPEGRVTSVTYDKVGRTKTLTTGVGSATPLTTTYAYDADGRMTSMTDPRGLVTQYGHDAAGRLLSVTDPANQITRATYDGNGNKLTETDPNGKTTTYTYDNANRPLTRTDANGQQWVTTYDENGNIKNQTVPATPSPRTTTFTYDALNRATEVAYPDGTTVAFTYDANGNRLTMTDSTGTTRYTYDALNRLSSKTDPQNKVVRYAYDGVGNVKTLTYPAGQSVTYGYDNAERLTTVTDWLSKTATYTLNRAGQVTTAAFGNGTRLEQTFDASGRLTNLVNRAADGSTISSHGLTLDNSDNITVSTGQTPLIPSLPNVDRVFTYDAANRLATMNGTAVVHDAAGRITSLNGDTYSYNDRDQITAITGTQTASYAYNGAGHRVSRTVNGTTTRFVIDPNSNLPEVLAETDSTGAVLRSYVYGNGLLEQIDSSNTAHYYHFDPTGSTLALTDAAGAISGRYAYTPYGETTTQGNTVNPFQYVGKLGVMDDGNGLHFMRARYYRPDIARFMSLDELSGSIDESQTLNRYAYAAGNPVTHIDPSGLVVDTVWDIANVVMGVASLVSNVTEHNWKDAAIDVAGLVVDGAATITPIVPGGAGTVIRGKRVAGTVTKSVNKVKRAPIDIDNHVLNAEIKPNGAVVGGHSIAAGNVKVIPGTASTPNAHGVYKAKIQVVDPKNPGQFMQKTNHNGISTMFPDHWETPQVNFEINSAYQSKVIIPERRMWTGITPSGVRVQGYTHPKTTVYPIY